MQISGRNKLPSVIKEIVKDSVVSKVVMECQGVEIVAVITTDSVESLNLAVGDKVEALIKATEVMVIK